MGLSRQVVATYFKFDAIDNGAEISIFIIFNVANSLWFLVIGSQYCIGLLSNCNAFCLYKFLGPYLAL